MRFGAGGWGHAFRLLFDLPGIETINTVAASVMITVETAKPDDVSRLVHLLEMLFSQEEDFCPDRGKQQAGLEMILRHPELGMIFVAREDDEGKTIVGMVSLLFSISTAEGGRVCWLKDMVVDPEARGKGIGSRQFADSLGIARVSLLTDGSNHSAKKFYQKHGFNESNMTLMRRRHVPMTTSNNTK